MKICEFQRHVHWNVFLMELGDKTSLVLAVAWYRKDNKPLPGPIMRKFLDAYIHRHTYMTLPIRFARTLSTSPVVMLYLRVFQLETDERLIVNWCILHSICKIAIPIAHRTPSNISIDIKSVPLLINFICCSQLLDFCIVDFMETISFLFPQWQQI